MAREKSSGEKRDRLIWLIALFKLMKAAVLIAVGVGALTLLHKDIASTLERWLMAVRIDPDNHFVNSILSKLGFWDDDTLTKLGIGTFLYATLFLIEGIGLLLRKRWAEYFTVIVTGSFIPLEVYEFARHASILKALAITLNVAVVIYLVIRLKQQRRSHHSKLNP